MVDWIAALISPVLGFAGGSVWWLSPPVPTARADVAKRVAAGALVGFLWHVVNGVSPFDSVGNWSPEGVLELVAAGFGGLAVLGALFPEQFDSGSIRFHAKRMKEKLGEAQGKLEKARGKIDMEEDVRKDLLELQKWIDDPAAMMSQAVKQSVEHRAYGEGQ